MPATLSYPGIYIEELPSSSHTITAAPTSITVFIGYTHPWKTATFAKAVRIKSFSDYERAFGGLFASGVFDNDLAYAVNQFFLNGGSDAYIFGLEPEYLDAGGNALSGGTDPKDPFFPTAPVRPIATVSTGGTTGINFRALMPTDAVAMKVAIVSPRPRDPSKSSATDTADLLVTYGTRVETYRGVSLDPTAAANFIEDRINGARGNAAAPPFTSALVTVDPSGAGGYGTAFPNKPQGVALPFNPPTGFASTFSAADFQNAFQADGDLDKLPIFNLMALPGVSDNGILSAALAFCEQKLAFLIVDPPQQAAADPLQSPLRFIGDLFGDIPLSTNGAFYYPYLKSLDPLTGNAIELPPSGYVAGIYAKTDNNVGVWKAPAGYETTLLNTTGVVERGRMTDPRQGDLNVIAINCLRDFPGVGTIVFGARTLVGATTNTAQQQNRYVPVRRMALFIEQTLKANLTWVIFRPNDEPLWVAIRAGVEDFLLGLFRQGALQGAKPSEAFQVKCDSTTTTPADQANGIVNIVVAFAPLRPAEFVVIQIAQLAGQAQT
jgi:phage tail sheath protein FI